MADTDLVARLSAVDESFTSTFERAKEAVEEFQASTETHAAQAANAIKDSTAKITGSFEKIKGGMESLAAVSGTAGGLLKSLAGAASEFLGPGGELLALLLAAGAAITEFATHTAEAAEGLVNLHFETGLSTDVIRGWQTASQEVGVSTQLIVRSIERMQMRMGHMATGAGFASLGGTSKAMTDLGLTMKDLADPSEALLKTMDKLNAAMEGQGNFTLLAGEAAQLWGRQIQRLMPVVAEGTEKIKALTAEGKEFGMTQYQLVRGDETAETLNQVGRAWNYLRDQLGSLFMPVVDALAATLRDLLATLALVVKGVNLTITTIKGAVELAGDWAAKNLTLANIQAALTDAWHAFVNMVKDAIAPLTYVIDSTLDWAKHNAFVQASLTALSSTWNNFVTLIQPAIDLIKGLLTQLTAWVSQNQALQTVLAAVGTAWEHLKLLAGYAPTEGLDGVTAAAQRAKAAVEGAAGAVADAAKTAYAKGSQLTPEEELKVKKLTTDTDLGGSKPLAQQIAAINAAAKTAEAQLAILEATNKRKLALGQETAVQELAQEQDLANRRFAIQRDALVQQRDLKGQQPAQIEKINSEIATLEATHQAKMIELQTKTIEARDKAEKEALSNSLKNQVTAIDFAKSQADEQFRVARELSDKKGVEEITSLLTLQNQELALNRQYLDQKYAAEKAEIEAEIALGDLSLEAKAALYTKLEELDHKHQLDVQKTLDDGIIANKKAADQIAAEYQKLGREMLQPFVQGIDSLVTGWLQGTQKMSEIWKKFLQSLVIKGIETTIAGAVLGGDKGSVTESVFGGGLAGILGKGVSGILGGAGGAGGKGGAGGAGGSIIGDLFGRLFKGGGGTPSTPTPTAAESAAGMSMASEHPEAGAPQEGGGLFSKVIPQMKSMYEDLFGEGGVATKGYQSALEGASSLMPLAGHLLSLVGGSAAQVAQMVIQTGYQAIIAAMAIVKAVPIIGTLLASGGTVPHADGGLKVSGGVPGKDSVLIYAMPDEGVLNTKAMSILGERAFNALNAGQPLHKVLPQMWRAAEGFSPPIRPYSMPRPISASTLSMPSMPSASSLARNEESMSAPYENHTHVHIHAIDAKSFEGRLHEHTETIARVVSGALRQPHMGLRTAIVRTAAGS